MKNTYRLIGFVILGIAASAVTGAVCEARRRNAMRRLLDTANEGYETAHDIIYPGKGQRRAKKLRYGPVYPGM
ncbi:hypothetical protein LQ567_15075 [Niabella pedocola]|uniref:YtxH domain-containing protein n=1 Tax=Niabella pedocola TaxID=1752077 RepID=A0ABS8PSP7_9BACT|nr:hypothetical protein [Niabella pedocola]MCD2424100.1 hypothetical protein [Niabella pedocola]